MRRGPESGASAGGDARYTPPQQLRVAARGRVMSAIAASVADHRVTIVTAPSGMGKSVAVSQWAATSRMPVAWLSLTRHDADAQRLSVGVVMALRKAAAASDDPRLEGLLDVAPESRDSGALYHAVCDALADAEHPIALVIDDLHRAGDAAQASLIGSLVELAPLSLRLILVGREEDRLPLDRLLLGGEAAVIRSDVLRMTAEEALDAAALFDLSLTLDDSERLVDAVDGWAAAVRLALVSGTASRQGSRTVRQGNLPQLTEYIADEILGALPDELREFVLDATTTSVLDEPLAEALTGREDAGALLEECVRRGLFLDRFGEGEGVVYRWHSVFAARCRAILRRAARARARRLHRAAAAFLAATDPLRSIDHSVAAADPETAVQTLRDGWVALLLGPNGDALDHACAALPEPWASDPEVLVIRACAVDVGGNRAEGQRMFRHALSRVNALAKPERDAALRTADVAGLFLYDDFGELGEAGRRVRADLTTHPPSNRLAYAAKLLMLGTTMVYRRTDMDAGVEVLSAAEATARELGEATIQRRAGALHAYMLAFRGDFAESERVLAQLDIEEQASTAWQVYLGGPENSARAWMAFWRNDLDDARRRFRREIDSGAGPTSFAGIARHYLAFIAAAVGDRKERADAAELLRALPDTEVHGLPWPAYRMLSAAKLAAADGRTDRAAAIARRFEHITYIPAAGVILAELVRQVIGGAEAVALLGQLRETGRAPYIRASALVTLALVQRDDGNTEDAHELFERALDLAAPLGVARPFADDRPELRAMLREHGAWGTRHAAFIASLSAPRRAASALSDREREVFGYLRTDMRIAEIAEQLGVSANTVKTHTRMIYRKLGVTNRREAIRALS
ncbi:LuxR C-terminal-related transcriptional regulator [Rathayibacter sp. CAU 1779]